MNQTIRPITVDMPAAYYDTFVDMFKGMGIKYSDSGNKAKSASAKSPSAARKAKPKRGSKEYILDSIVEGVREAKLYEQGLIELPSAWEVLNEL
ncbi:MAG: hypothetical protein J6I49_01335 [Bacteroidales bacterium]|nr:hypothetical protein [Bacteroidales bacterium]